VSYSKWQIGKGLDRRFCGMWLIITVYIPTLTTGIDNIINAVVCEYELIK